jgi:hypothetical protein
MPIFVAAPNDLPTIIDATGTYLCRNGQYATIHEIRYMPDHKPEYTAFPAKGNRMVPSKKVPTKVNGVFDIWHVSGRLLPLEEDGWDIVSKVVDEKDINYCMEEE